MNFILPNDDADPFVFNRRSFEQDIRTRDVIDQHLTKLTPMVRLNDIVDLAKLPEDRKC